MDNTLAIYEALRYTWAAHAHSYQLTPPGEWDYWLFLGGRGGGKTRSGAEWIRQKVESCRRIAFVGATAASVRDVMIKGESGIIEVFPKAQRPVYRSSKRLIEFHNGAQALLFSAETPDQLRGPQFDAAWCDELCSWKYIDETWDMLQFGLRLGNHPQAIITSTPRPLQILKELMKNPRTVVTKCTTYDNRANLASTYIEHIISKYEGTRLGRQELNAEIIDDNPAALWKREWIENNRVLKCPELKRITVSVDPAVTATKKSDETGITVQGIGVDGQFYLLDDCSVKSASPDEWAKAVVTAYNKYKADCVVCESNQGGDMVISTIKTVGSTVNVKKIYASRGKTVRAEPVSALSEQGRVHHVGVFPLLEDQLCQWDSSETYSPDRLDAFVHGINELNQRPEKKTAATRRYI